MSESSPQSHPASLQVTPLVGTFGAEVDGIDLLTLSLIHI